MHIKLKDHNKKLLDPNFWKDKSHSQRIIKEKKLYEDLVTSYEKSILELNDFDDRPFNNAWVREQQLLQLP